MRAIGYSRVSTTTQADKDQSIPKQNKAIREMVRDYGLDLVDIYEDGGKSARSDKRPGFQEAVAYSVNPKNDIKYFIVYDTSRFARNRYDAAVYKKTLRDAGVEILYSTVKIDVGTQEGAMLEGFNEIIDEAYSIKVSLWTSSALKENALNGFYNGGKPPFGYQIEKVEAMTRKGQTKKSRLEVEPYEAKLVHEIFDLAISGAGCAAIAKHLNKKEHFRRGRPWTKPSIHRLLHRKTYIGEHIYTIKGEEVVLQVPLIIDPEVFERAKNAISKRSFGSGRSAGVKHVSLLAGLLFHSQCGSRMVRNCTKKGRYQYYICPKQKEGLCQGERIAMKRADQEVLGDLIKALDFTDEAKHIEKILNKRYKLDSKDRKKEVKKAQTKLMQFQQKKDRLIKALASGVIEVADIQDQMNEFKKQIGFYENRIKELNTETKQHQFDAKDIIAVGNFLRSRILKEDDVRMQKRFVSDLVKKILFDGQNFYYVLRDSESEEWCFEADSSSLSKGWRERRDSNSRPLA